MRALTYKRVRGGFVGVGAGLAAGVAVVEAGLAAGVPEAGVVVVEPEAGVVVAPLPLAPVVDGDAAGAGSWPGSMIGFDRTFATSSFSPSSLPSWSCL
jgi:hypothetical protein